MDGSGATGDGSEGCDVVAVEIAMRGFCLRSCETFGFFSDGRFFAMNQPPTATAILIATQAATRQLPQLVLLAFAARPFIDSSTLIADMPFPARSSKSALRLSASKHETHDFPSLPLYVTFQSICFVRIESPPVLSRTGFASVCSLSRLGALALEGKTRHAEEHKETARRFRNSRSRPAAESSIGGAG